MVWSRRGFECAGGERVGVMMGGCWHVVGLGGDVEMVESTRVKVGE